MGPYVGRPMRVSPDRARLLLLGWRGRNSLITALVRTMAEDVDEAECPYCPRPIERIVQLPHESRE